MLISLGAIIPRQHADVQKVFFDTYSNGLQKSFFNLYFEPDL